MPANLHRIFVDAIDPKKRSTSAILLNQSGKTIVSFEVAWRYEQEGRKGPSNSVDYWNQILNGSKRYIGEDGTAGDNSDVRPPAPDEVPKGGGAGSGRGTSRAANSPASNRAHSGGAHRQE